MSFFEINKQRRRASEAESSLRSLERRNIRVAANAVILRDNQVLLVEFDDASGLHYNFPGGGVEPGETLEEALRREVREETSLKVSVQQLLLIVESVESRNTNLIRGRPVPWNELRFFFLCATSPRAKARRPEVFDENQTGVRWVPINSLDSIKVLPNVSRELLRAIDSHSPLPAIVANPHA